MALFQQKKPQVSSSIPLYTLGQNKTILLVGLGNIGAEYDNTRHNIGFDILDKFAADHDFPAWIEKKDLSCRMAVNQLGSTRVIIIKPTTFMNQSGSAVQAVSHFYRLQPSDITVIHDELDIPFGQIRTRTGGSPAGHNGIKSISNAIGEDYGRVRVGIGPKTHESMDSADFVLGRFSKDQQSQMNNLLREASAILSEFVYSTTLPNETRSFIV